MFSYLILNPARIILRKIACFLYFKYHNIYRHYNIIDLIENIKSIFFRSFTIICCAIFKQKYISLKIYHSGQLDPILFITKII